MPHTKPLAAESTPHRRFLLVDLWLLGFSPGLRLPHILSIMYFVTTSLRVRIADRIVDTLWRLSTELLKLQLTVLDAKEGDEVPIAAGHQAENLSLAAWQSAHNETKVKRGFLSKMFSKK